MKLFQKEKTEEKVPINPSGMRIRHSGPIDVAEFDCHGCPGFSDLADPNCRACVLERLGVEGKADQVMLARAYCRIYTSPDLSKLAQRLTTLRQLMLDRTLYAAGEVEARCKACIDERIEKMERLWRHLLRNPHDLLSIDELRVREGREGKCDECTRDHFFKLLERIEASMKPLVEGLSPLNYDERFEARTKPFFVEGVWHPLMRRGRLLESYELPGRGIVRIYEQLDRPVPFYELDLPEFKLPPEHVELLDEAFRLKLKEAPGHARFAYSQRMLGFAEDLYNALLHMMRERKGITIPSTELQKLARYMASWLTYRVLEPLSHDDHITNIYASSPPELQPLTIDHERWGRCETGIYWSTPSLRGLGETLASRKHDIFDETKPRLDVEIPELGMRLFLTRPPAIWQGIEAAIRKRRSKPWTQLLFLERGTLTPLASSMLSNVFRLGCSGCYIGDIDTAKTSGVETTILEIGPGQRVVAFQDTEELHLEDFITHGYKVANVRVGEPKQLEAQVNAFLRGGPSYWLITEVRETEAVRAALGAAARQGSQPVIASFHARSKREMFDLIVHIMGLHEAAFKYVDFIASTARFWTPSGTIRRVVEIAEVLKDWEGRPEYVELFKDDRKLDLLVSKNFLRGDQRLIEKLNSYDLSEIDPIKFAEELEFLPPDEGGSRCIPFACKKLAIDEGDFLTGLLAEARMKSDLLMLARRTGDLGYLELPFASKAYDVYFSLVKKHAPDYEQVLGGWESWLKNAI